jgi:DNA-binding beta-propeller fold protein YncE
MYPFGISFDRNDNLYVSDSGNDQVKKFLQGSTIGIEIAKGIGDLFIDSDDTLFILGSDKVPTRKLNLNNFQMETIMSHEGDPWSIYVNQNGDIYISENFHNNHTAQVSKYSYDHETIKKETIFTAKDKVLGIFVDQCNTLYAAISSENGTIEKFYSSNSNSVIIASNLSYPADVLLDKYGNLYFIQLGINSIRRINARDGKTQVIINEIEKVTTGYREYRYSWPMNIAFDSKFNLYVSDQDSHDVKMFLFEGGDLFC